MKASARSRRRLACGFTLIELLVYLGLVGTAVTVFGGIELAAQRAVAMQQALVDIDGQALLYLGALRRDVEAARSWSADAAGLRVTRADGTTVAYRTGERIELDAQGGVVGQEPFRNLVALEVLPAHQGRGLRVEATFAARLGWRDEVRRTFVRSAVRRLEAAHGE